MQQVGILVPQPGIEPMPLALGAQSLNHWTAREVPIIGGQFEETKLLVIFEVCCILIRDNLSQTSFSRTKTK